MKNNDDNHMTAPGPAPNYLRIRELRAAAEEMGKAHKDISQFAVQHEHGTGEVWTWSDAATWCFDRAGFLRAEADKLEAL